MKEYKNTHTHTHTQTHTHGGSIVSMNSWKPVFCKINMEHHGNAMK